MTGKADMSEFDIWMEIVQEEKKYFDSYEKYARKIKEVLERELESVRVFVFGSVVEVKHTPASDIDVLAVSTNMPRGMKRAELRGKVLREIGVFSPFEIHLADEKEFEWYRRFAEKMIEIE